jgi:hypothetical protein
MGHVTQFTFMQAKDLLEVQTDVLLLFCCFTQSFDGLHDAQPRPKERKKNKSNARKRSGDNEKAILWTPLLTPFAQTDMLGPKGLGFLLYGERVERNLMGHMPIQRMVLVGCAQ